MNQGIIKADKKYTLFLFLIILLCLSSFQVQAKELGIEKKIVEEELKVGSPATILLNFTNPFNTSVFIQIVDKNILGNNGLDVQCYELELPNQNYTAIMYSPLVMYESGSFTLSEAEITYINPEDKKEDTVKSNSLKVKIAENPEFNQVAQGITSVYQCNGQNIQTQSSSSSSSSQSKEEQEKREESIQDQLDKAQEQFQNKLQNNQMNQDSNALKQQMEEQVKEQQQKEQEFKESLQNNEELQKAKEQIENEGFNQKSESVDPESKDSGEFNYEFENQDGEKASLSGSMKNGTIENMEQKTEKGLKSMVEEMKSDGEFKKMDEQLKKEGLNEGVPSMEKLPNNSTKVTLPYSMQKDNQTINKSIIATFENGNMTSVKIVDPEKERKKSFWLWTTIILLLAAVAMFVVSKKRKISEVKQEEENNHKSFNYKKEALALIKEAKQLFEKGEKKESYAKVSYAVRLFYSYKLKLKKEITSAVLVKYMKGKKLAFKDVLDCLNMCALVEFAKYSPNKSDFEKIISLAESSIK